MPYTLPTELFRRVETPFYYYDTQLLSDTLDTVSRITADAPDYVVHYAIKANSNPKVLRLIASKGFGADCVSGGEIQAAVEAGIPGKKIVFAGVGKRDWEINLALEVGIACFNVESLEELEVINSLALAKGAVAPVAFRINPNIDAHTHANITTGLSENKFGISMEDMTAAVRRSFELPGVSFYGLHFHIGSQTLEYSPFVELCKRVATLREQLSSEGITIPNLNVGGGLGIDYDTPDANPIPDFEGYFDTFRKNLTLDKGQKLHFELGRSIVGQCGSLISEVIYVKKGTAKQFLIVDAGFTDLIRPALYEAHHHIDVLTSSSEETEVYDVVGPICESSDVFNKDLHLPRCKRGDIIALRSAGAYGEVMASGYNNRKVIKGYSKEQLEAI